MSTKGRKYQVCVLAKIFLDLSVFGHRKDICIAIGFGIHRFTDINKVLEKLQL